MNFEGAVIREQGITFAVAIVKPHILRARNEAADLINYLSRELFHGLPVVLMAQDARGTPTYYGRNDLARFLANVPLHTIPWRSYRATAA